MGNHEGEIEATTFKWSRRILTGQGGTTSLASIPGIFMGCFVLEFTPFLYPSTLSFAFSAGSRFLTRR